MIALPPLLIIGEIIPKSIGRQQATVLAEKLAPPLRAASWVIYPISLVFGGLSRVVLIVAGVRKTAQLPFITRDDLHLVVASSWKWTWSGGAHFYPPHPAVFPA